MLAEAIGDWINYFKGRKCLICDYGTGTFTGRIELIKGKKDVREKPWNVLTIDSEGIKFSIPSKKRPMYETQTKMYLELLTFSSDWHSNVLTY